MRVEIGRKMKKKGEEGNYFPLTERQKIFSVINQKYTVRDGMNSREFRPTGIVGVEGKLSLHTRNTCNNRIRRVQKKR